MNPLINNLVTALNGLGSGFCDYAGLMFIQSGVLIILLLFVDFLIRRRVRATLRYWIWMLVFVKLILPPSLSLPTGLGYWRGEILSTARSISEQESTKIQLISGVPLVLGATPPPMEATPIQPAQTNLEPTGPSTPIVSLPNALTWQMVVFVLWLVGALIFSVVLIQRILYVRRLIAQSGPAEKRFAQTLDQCRKQVGICRSIELRLSNDVSSPAVCGFLKPVILIPTALIEKLSPDRLRAVLIHELCHIKRGDLWANAAQTILQIIYFYNPLVWLTNVVVRRIREQAVDEMVLVTLGTEAKIYSNTLIDIAEMSFSRPALSLRLVGVVESKKALSHRIKHILYRPFPKSAKLGILGLLTVIIAASILLPMAKANKEINISKTDSSTGKLTATLPNDVTGELTEGKYPDTGYIIPANVSLNRIRNHRLGLFFLNEKRFGGFRNISDYEEFMKFALLFGGDIYYYYDKKEKVGKAVFPRQNYWEREQAASITLKNLPLETTVGTVDGREYKIRFTNHKTERLETLIGPWDGKRLNPKDQCIIQYYCTNDATFILPSSGGTGFNSVIENVLTKKENRVFEGIYCAIFDGDKIIVYCNYNDSLLDSIFGDRKIAKELQLERIATNKWQITGARVYLKSLIESDKRSYLKNNPETQLWEKSENEAKTTRNITQKVSLQGHLSDFTATLPNGVTVELVGVCEHPSTGKQWWKPDGTELKERPYDTIPGKLSCTEDEKAYEFAVSFKNFPKDAVAGIQTEPIGSSIGGSIFSTVYKVGKEVKDMGYRGTCFDRNVKTCSIKIISAYGEWKTLAENTDTKGSSVHGIGIGLVAFSQIFEEKGKSAVTVTHSITRNYEKRVMAVDSNGNEREPQSDNTAGGGEFDQMVILFDLKPADISKFLFQTRPYESVTFRNVSLQPGVKTDVKVDVADCNENSLFQSGQNEQVVGIIKDVDGNIGQITAEHGDAVYGNNIKYTPGLYLGRVRKGDKVQLMYSNVIQNQYGIPVIKIKTISSNIGLTAGTIGWISLKDTSFKDQFVASENISLQRGLKTDVKIEAERPDIQTEESTRTILLPDVDSKGLMLDLASGELLDIPKTDTEEEIWSAIEKLGKGDVVYDASSLILVRGATTQSPTETITGPFKACKIEEKLPVRLTITTKEGIDYAIKVHSADNSGCRFEYYSLGKNDGQIEAMRAFTENGLSVDNPEGNREVLARQLAILEQERDRLAEKIEQYRQTIRELGDEFGDIDLERRQQMMLDRVVALMETLTKTETERIKLETEIQFIERTKEQPMDQEKLFELRQAYINGDPVIKAYAEDIIELEREIIVARQTKTASHPEIQRKTDLLKVLKERLAELKRQASTTFEEMTTKEAALAGEKLLAAKRNELEQKKAFEIRLRETLSEQDSQAIELGRKQLAIDDFTTELELTQKRYDLILDRIMELKSKIPDIDQ